MNDKRYWHGYISYFDGQKDEIIYDKNVNLLPPIPDTNVYIYFVESDTIDHQPRQLLREHAIKSDLDRSKPDSRAYLNELANRYSKCITKTLGRLESGESVCEMNKRVSLSRVVNEYMSEETYTGQTENSLELISTQMDHDQSMIDNDWYYEE